MTRVRQVIDGREYLGGWVVHASGDQRGAVLEGGAVVATPRLGPFTLTAPLPGGGVLAARQVQPRQTLAQFPE